MEDSRLISIVIGSYNGADFLNETVDSILAQTYKKYRIDSCGRWLKRSNIGNYVSL